MVSSSSCHYSIAVSGQQQGHQLCGAHGGQSRFRGCMRSPDSRNTKREPSSKMKRMPWLAETLPSTGSV